MTTLLLARHGETDWNGERRWQGHYDQPLNDTGRDQAAELAASLAGTPIAAIYSSDLVRARETAEIVAERLGLNVVVDAGLREVDVGNWSGVTHDEIRQLYPEGFARWQEGGRGWEGGESYDQMGERAVATLLRLADASRRRDRPRRGPRRHDPRLPCRRRRRHLPRAAGGRLTAGGQLQRA